MRMKLLVDLLVPVSPSNPKLQGACSLAHKWFMVYYLLVERHLVDLRVTPVSPNHPSPGYKRLHVGRRLPVVLVSRPISVPSHPVIPYARLADLEPEIIAETEDEQELLMERWAVPGFIPQTIFAPLICELVLGLKYLLYHGSERRLQNGLTQLNELLSETGEHFLTTDHPVYIDCSLAPKLQHLRVAGAYFRGYQIPDTLKYVWMYLANMYNLEAFRVSCPTDKDILLHYLERIPGLDVTQIDTQKKRIFRLPDTCRLFTYPIDIAHEPFESQNSSDSRTPNQRSPDTVTRLQKYQTQTNLNCETLYRNSDDASSATTAHVRGVNSSIERTSFKRFNYLYRQIPPFRYCDSNT